jgi:hypothetical protein
VFIARRNGQEQECIGEGPSRTLESYFKNRAGSTANSETASRAHTEPFEGGRSQADLRDLLPRMVISGGMSAAAGIFRLKALVDFVLYVVEEPRDSAVRPDGPAIV